MPFSNDPKSKSLSPYVLFTSSTMLDGAPVGFLVGNVGAPAGANVGDVDGTNVGDRVGANVGSV